MVCFSGFNEFVKYFSRTIYASTVLTPSALSQFLIEWKIKTSRRYEFSIAKLIPKLYLFRKCTLTVFENPWRRHPYSFYSKKELLSLTFQNIFLRSNRKNTKTMADKSPFGLYVKLTIKYEKTVNKSFSIYFNAGRILDILWCLYCHLSVGVEPVTQGYSTSKSFWKLSQNSQENTYGRSSFSIKLQAVNL